VDKGQRGGGAERGALVPLNVLDAACRLKPTPLGQGPCRQVGASARSPVDV
jgi:hypothetical protein